MEYSDKFFSDDDAIEERMGCFYSSSSCVSQKIHCVKEILRRLIGLFEQASWLPYSYG